MAGCWVGKSDKPPDFGPLFCDWSPCWDLPWWRAAASARCASPPRAQSFRDLSEGRVQCWYKVHSYELVNPTFKFSLISPEFSTLFHIIYFYFCFVGGRPLFLSTKSFMGCPLPLYLTLTPLSVGTQGTRLSWVLLFRGITRGKKGREWGCDRMVAS